MPNRPPDNVPEPEGATRAGGEHHDVFALWAAQKIDANFGSVEVPGLGVHRPQHGRPVRVQAPKPSRMPRGTFGALRAERDLLKLYLMAPGRSHILACALILSSGCELAPKDELGSLELAIVDGQVHFGDPAVGMFKTGVSVCTLTMVYRSFALTARHCVQERELGDDGRFRLKLDLPTYPIEGMRVSFEPQPSEGSGEWYGVRNFMFHPEADLAVVQLDRSPPASVPMNDVRIDAFVGQPVKIVGYGKTVTAPASAEQQSGIKRIGYSSFFRTAKVRDLGEVFVAGLTTGQEGAKLCQGDSGGPAFMTINGQEVLAGVNSVVGRAQAGSGTIVCENEGTFNAHVRVDSHQEFIADAIATMEGRSTRVTGGCGSGGGGSQAVLLTLLGALLLLRRRKLRTNAKRQSLR